MAKKPKGYYSPEAIQGRQQQQLDEHNRQQKAANKAEQGVKGQKQPAIKPVQQIGTKTAGSVPFSPMDANWDYRTAKTDRMGRPLEARNFFGKIIKPKGFDPRGQAYFGEGISAWLNKWAWKFSEEAATKSESDAAWDKFGESWSRFKFLSSTRSAPVSMDEYRNNPEAREKEGQERPAVGAAFLQSVGDLWNASSKFIEANDKSFNKPLTFAVRTVNTAVGMTLDAFQWASELPEKSGGALRAMREYSTEQGSILPALSFDRNLEDYKDWDGTTSSDNGFKADGEAADFISRLIFPVLAGYDQLRFWTSEGSFEEKKAVVQQGWMEGRMLYTEMFKAGVRAEYQSRMMAGEDPALLAMELEDPWMELAGEVILDPLNFLGLLGKAKKAGQALVEAENVVQGGGLFKNPEVIEIIKKLPDLPNTEAQATAKRVAGIIADEASLARRRNAAVQGFKLSSFLPSANKIRQRRAMGNYISAVTQAIRNAGGTPDDVLELVNALRKFASGNEAEIIEGMGAISKLPVQMLAYNDAAFDTGYMLNKILNDGDLLADMNKVSGNYVELAKWFDRKIEKAVDYAFPSVMEMKRAGTKYKELLETGVGLTAKGEKTKDFQDAERLSEAFKVLQKEHPGYVKWAQFQDLAESTLQPINGFLANNYFSLSYGYAARNFLQNMFTLWVDGGLIWEKGKLASTSRLDDILMKLHGGEMPDVFRYTKTFVEDTTRGSLGNRFFSWLNSKKYSPAQLAQAAEIYAGKMIYVKKYRETMDRAATFGGMFPELSKWQDAGYSAEQAKDFIDMFRANNYDELATFEAFARKHGDGSIDKWRMLDWVNPKAKKGLQENGSLWDEITDYINKTDNPTQRDVLAHLDELKIKVKKDANKAALEPTRVDTEDAKDMFTRGIMNDAEFAGKFKDPKADNALLTQRLQAERALNEFTNALDDFRDGLIKTGDNVLSEQIRQAKRSLQPLKEATLRKADEMREWAITARNKVASGANPADVWDEAVMGLKPKQGLITREMFYEQLWQKYYFPARAQVWNGFYDDMFKKFMDFAGQKPELAQLFDKANLEYLRYNQYADYIYSEGQIFAKAPIINPSAIGDTANANNVRSLGNAYGIASVGQSGANKDKHLLNIINRYGAPEGIDPGVLARIKEKARKSKEAIARGESAFTEETREIRDFISKMSDDASVKMREFGKAQRAARAEGRTIKMTYDNITQVVQSLPNEAASFGIETILKRAEQFGVKVPDEMVKFFEASGGQITRSDTLEFAARFDMGKVQKGVAAPVEALETAQLYNRLEDVPLDVAEKAFAKSEGQTYKQFVKRVGDKFESNNLTEGLPVVPPRDPNVSPAGHVFSETKEGMLAAISHIQEGILQRWGQKVATNPDVKALQALIPDLGERAAFARMKSQRVAEKMRDFALLPYGEKTNMDFALSLVYPYQFWYSRSYKNWMQRAFMTNPEIISRYANLKDAMVTEQQDLPDWWKSQFDVTRLLPGGAKDALAPAFSTLGIDIENPIYINLEAAVFPLYGLTGTDFNEPRKRVDWWTSTLDDMGKFGPSIFAPLQIATAAYLSLKGEKEAASYWGSRLIPQTATFKAVSSFFGKPIELDPMVWAFSGGIDPYEERRIARALSAMRMEGIPEEILLEQAHARKGEYWDEAYRRATQQRAPGQIASFLFGTGFKMRSPEDVKVDQFYSDYTRMKNLYKNGLMTDEQYRQSFSKMKEAYPFMDIMLLSRRAGADRDTAYAYNVISRIPPGEMGSVAEVLGVKPYMLEQFYDNKGDLSKMTPQDRDRFMAAVIDLSAMLKMPDGATREEWNLAKQNYSNMNERLEQMYGPDILDKINTMYELNGDDKQKYLSANPDVEQALQFKNEMIIRTPILAAYYGGLEVVERYYNNQVRDTLEQEFGKDIYDKYEQYQFLQDNLQKADAKRFYRENNLDAFVDRRNELYDEADKLIIASASQIPEGRGYTIRPDFQTQSGYQEEAFDYTQTDQQAEMARAIWNDLTPAVRELVQESIQTGEDPPYQVMRQIERIADRYGISQYEAMRLLGVEMQP